MNATYRELGQEHGWDARTPVDTMIEASPFALLKEGEVLLVINSEGETLSGVTLTNENGLHYDGDTSIEKAYAQHQIEEGEWAVTQEWQTVEDWIRQ